MQMKPRIGVEETIDILDRRTRTKGHSETVKQCRESNSCQFHAQTAVRGAGVPCTQPACGRAPLRVLVVADRFVRSSGRREKYIAVLVWISCCSAEQTVSKLIVSVRTVGGHTRGAAACFATFFQLEGDMSTHAK